MRCWPLIKLWRISEALGLLWRSLCCWRLFTNVVMVLAAELGARCELELWGMWWKLLGTGGISPGTGVDVECGKYAGCGFGIMRGFSWGGVTVWGFRLCSSVTDFILRSWGAKLEAGSVGEEERGEERDGDCWHWYLVSFSLWIPESYSLLIALKVGLLRRSSCYSWK